MQIRRCHSLLHIAFTHMKSTALYHWIDEILLSFRIRLSIVGIVLFCIAAMFPFVYREVGSSAGALITVAVLITSIFLGIRTGLIIWILTIPLYILEVSLVRQNAFKEVLDSWPGILVTLILTIIFGLLKKGVTSMWYHHQSELHINGARLKKINDCFLSFEANPEKTIKRLIFLAGDLLGAKCVFYTRVLNGQFSSIVFIDASEIDQAACGIDHRLSCSLLDQNSEEILIVRNIQKNPYRCVITCDQLHPLHTYAGKAIRIDSEFIGSLSVVFENDVILGSAEKNILGIISSGIAAEEKRKRMEDALLESKQQRDSILNEVLDVVWSLSWPEMAVNFISPSVEHVFGCTVHEFEEIVRVFVETQQAL
jgi:hypothetical protein